MPAAEAHAATDRASRYLAQLCRHLDQMSHLPHQSLVRHGGGPTPPRVQSVDYSDTRAVVRFAEGQWILHATPDGLTLRVETEDEESLQRLRDGITMRLEKIGRRDGLTVTWRQPHAGEDPTEADPPVLGAGTEPRRRRGRGRTIAMVAVVAAVVAVHVGLGGAALAESSWTGLAANTLLAIVLLKVVFMGSHVILGRMAIRRGRTVKLPWTRHRSPSS